MTLEPQPTTETATEPAESCRTPRSGPVTYHQPAQDGSHGPSAQGVVNLALLYGGRLIAASAKGGRGFASVAPLSPAWR